MIAVKYAGRVNTGTVHSHPTISVALCTHNGMPFVAEQVRSILHQSEPPSELVISDDASSDETIATIRGIVDRFRAERPAVPLKLVVLLNSSPLGVTANFEQAILACTGDLVALCDQDDVWVPDRLAVVAGMFAERPELTLVHSDARLVNSEGEPIGTGLAASIEFTPAEQRKVHRGDAFGVLLQRNVVTGATAVFRRELVHRAVPFPNSWVHDEWLAMMASITGQVDYLPQPLIDYRQHSGNQIGARRATLGDKVSRLTERRIDRNRRLAARAAAFADHVGHMEDVPDRVRALVRQKAEHEKWRSALPASRIGRVIPVLGAALRGRYRRFGRARYDIVRDLFQPAG